MLAKDVESSMLLLDGWGCWLVLKTEPAWDSDVWLTFLTPTGRICRYRYADTAIFREFE